MTDSEIVDWNNLAENQTFILFVLAEICYFTLKHPRNLTWMEAKDMCIKHKSTLAIFHTDAIQKQVQLQIAHIQALDPFPVYIGLCKEVSV